MALTYADFLRKFVKVPEESTRRLIKLTLHPEQQRYVAALDRRDPATGLRAHREFLLSWLKKAGKSTTAASTALWALVGDDLADDREVIIVASDLSQSKDVVYATACKIIRRDPWLRKHLKIGATEITYTEQVREPRTGGTYEQSHVLRAVPRDVKGLHGFNASCIVFDEFWTQDDYELVEALAPSPARRSPITLYASYAGLKSQRKEGNPLFDLWTRARRSDDPQLFASILTGTEAWRSIPWITERWVEQMRRLYATVPSKFQRLVCNQWASSESTLITTEELQAACDTELSEPERGMSGTRYALGLDIGLSFDWTAMVLAHADPEGRFVVDMVRTWRGTRTKPVDLTDVEAAIIEIHERFRPAYIRIDQWQAAYLRDRLQRLNIGGVELVTIEPAKLDHLTTMLKGLFARREIVIPASQHDLLEQLETLQVVETGQRNRRRDRIRFDSGTGTGAGAHDDIVVALALAAEPLERSFGRRRLPDEFRSCNWIQYHKREMPCFLWVPGGLVPSGDPTCTHCPGWKAVKARMQSHIERGGEPMDYRTFYDRTFEPNDLVTNMRIAMWVDQHL